MSPSLTQQRKLLDLPLYAQENSWLIEDVDEVAPVIGCDLCSRCKSARICGFTPNIKKVNPNKQPAIVIAPYPDREEDRTGIVLSSRRGVAIRKMVEDIIPDRDIIYVYALNCYGPREPTAVQIRQCRPYLAKTILENNPKYVIPLGNISYTALTGTTGNRLGAYSWARDFNVWARYFRSPKQIMTNAYMRREFTDALESYVGETPPPEPPIHGNAYLVNNETDALRVEQIMRDAEWVSFDVETYGRRYYDSDYKLLSVALTASGSDDGYVWPEHVLNDRRVRAPLKRVLEECKLVGQNIKFDITAVYVALGITCTNVYADTRLLSKLLDHDMPAGLAAQSGLVGMGAHKSEAHAYVKAEEKRLKELNGREAVSPGAYAYAAVPSEILSRYNALDTVVTARLANQQLAALQNFPTLLNHWHTFLGEASVAISHMERWGIPADKRVVESFSSYLELEQEKTKIQLRSYGEFNPDSPIEVAEILYNKYNLPVLAQTPTGRPAVNKNTLAKLESMHPVVRDILWWRKLGKMRSTYADGLLPYIAKDGRIRPNFMLDGAASGRLSCREPNLQNVPRADTQLGAMIRKAFAAPKGYTFVQADYGTLELRVAAILSQDPAMAEVFNSGVDYHLKTAKMVSQAAWGVSPDKVTKEHRTAAKAVNFGLLYGMSDYALGKTINCSTSAARKIRDAVLGSFPGLAQWIRGELRNAKKTGYARTYWGRDENNNNIPTRIRPLRNLWSAEEKIRLSAERAAWNTPVQGTASDFCLGSVVNVVKWILEDMPPAKLVLTVHDSIMLEVEDSAVDECCWKLHHLMTDWDTGNVPLTVDIETGKSWADMVPYGGWNAQSN